MSKMSTQIIIFVAEGVLKTTFFERQQFPCNLKSELPHQNARQYQTEAQGIIGIKQPKLYPFLYQNGYEIYPLIPFYTLLYITTKNTNIAHTAFPPTKYIRPPSKNIFYTFFAKNTLATARTSTHPLLQKRAGVRPTREGHNRHARDSEDINSPSPSGEGRGEATREGNNNITASILTTYDLRLTTFPYLCTKY